MGDDADAQRTAIALAPYVLGRIDAEARDDYQSCLDAGESQVALVLLFGFIKDETDIPADVLADAFQALDVEHKEEFRHLLEPRLARTA